MLTSFLLSALCATFVVPATSDPLPATAGLPASVDDGSELVLYPAGEVGPVLEGAHLQRGWFPLGDPGDGQDWDEEDGPGVVENVLYEMLPDEFEYEDRLLELRDGGVLAMRAPHDTQNEVTRVLDGLAAAFRRPARVTLRVFDVLDPQRVGSAPSAAQLDALTESGALREVWDRTADVAIGTTTRFGGSSRRSYLSGFEREIAQDADVALPVFGMLREGVELVLRVETDGDGFALRTLARRSDLRDLEAREVFVNRLLKLDTAVQQDRRPCVLELPVVETSCAASSRRVALGGHAVSVLWTTTEAGLAGCVVDVSLDAVAPAPPPVEVRGRTAYVIDGSRTTWGPLGVSRPELGAFVPFDAEGHRGFDTWRDLGEPMRVEFPSEQYDSATWQTLLDGLLVEDGVSWYEVGSWSVLVGDGRRIAPALTAATRQLPRHRPLGLRLGVTETGTRGETRLRALLDLPTETASTAFGIVGDARGLASTIEADVASGVASSSPVQGQVFDGIAVRASSGERDVVLDLVLARLDDVESIPLRGLIGLDVDRPVLTTGQTTVRVPLDGERHEVARIPSAGRDLVVWAEARLD